MPSTLACWLSPFASSTASPSSLPVWAETTLFQATSPSCTSSSRHRCGWPFSCGTLTILVASSKERTPRCRPRGWRGISAVAVANVVATSAVASSATLALTTTALQMMWSWRATETGVPSRSAAEVVSLPGQSMCFWTHHLGTLLQTVTT
jgi:hypothetical protein